MLGFQYWERELELVSKQCPCNCNIIAQLVLVSDSTIF